MITAVTAAVRTPTAKRQMLSTLSVCPGRRGALGGTRTPNLLIRSPGPRQTRHDCERQKSLCQQQCRAWSGTVRWSQARPLRSRLRSGASQYKAAGVDTKYISAMLGHARTSFTDDVYVTLFPDVAREAAERAAAVVSPERKRS